MAITSKTPQTKGLKINYLEKYLSIDMIINTLGLVKYKYMESGKEVEINVSPLEVLKQLLIAAALPTVETSQSDS